MTRPGPSPHRLRTLLMQFKKRYGAQYHLCALGCFGSYAHHTATPEIDIDIVFDTDAPNLFRTAMMKQDLEQFLGRPVDAVQLCGLTNLRLKQRIEQEAIYV